MAQEIKLIERIPKSEESPSGYRYIEPNSLNKPTIIVLAGGETCDSKEANGGAKVVQMLLTGNKNKFPQHSQIISAQYPDNYNIQYRTRTLELMRNNHNYYDAKVRQLFEQNFLPLLAKDIEIDGDEVKANKLPLLQIKKNLRNINIFAYSYGGVVAEQIGNAMRDYMNKIGYDAEEIKQTMEQISLLTLGSVGNIDNTDNKFTTLHIVNEGDDIIAERSPRNIKIADKLLGAARSGHSKIDDSDRQIVLLQENDMLLEVVKEKGKDKAYLTSVYGFKHDLKSYVNFAFEQNPMQATASKAQIYLAKSLNNSVINSKRENFIELPDAKDIMSNNPFQTRLMVNKFNQAIDNSKNH